MNKIENSERGLTIHNVIMDFLKSDYMLAAQNLMWAILNSGKEMTPESEEQVEYAINYLVNSKEDLTDSMGACIELVDNLSQEVEEYLMEVKNDIQ